MAGTFLPGIAGAAWETGTAEMLAAEPDTGRDESQAATLAIGKTAQDANQTQRNRAVMRRLLPGAHASVKGMVRRCRLCYSE
jgi:hypothetical protein